MRKIGFHANREKKFNFRPSGLVELLSATSGSTNSSWFPAVIEWKILFNQETNYEPFSRMKIAGFRK